MLGAFAMSHMRTGANFLELQIKLATATSKNFENIICEICEGFAYGTVIVLKARHLGIKQVTWE